MIGILTSIRVLERKKEIGIIRSLGVSKRNIRKIFKDNITKYFDKITRLK